MSRFGARDGTAKSVGRLVGSLLNIVAREFVVRSERIRHGRYRTRHLRSLVCERIIGLVEVAEVGRGPNKRQLVLHRRLGRIRRRLFLDVRGRGRTLALIRVKGSTSIGVITR